MRTPDALNVKEQCRSSIDQIVKKYGLPIPKEIKIDDQGWVNVTIFLNDSWVVRFNARDTHLPKFQREKIIFDKLNQIIPVPECLALDNSRTDVPFDYMICKKIEGENLEKKWPHLDVKSGHELAFHAGKILSHIHSIEMEDFGEISNSGPFPKTKSWTEYLRFFLNYHLDEAMKLKIFSEAERLKFLTLFEECSMLFDELKTPKIVHGDFHFGNLLYLENKITGVVDFEWACAGDPLFDISTQLRNMDSSWPKSQDAFNYGYYGHSQNEYSTDELKKMRVYGMIKSIELCVVAYKFFSEAEAKEYAENTRKNYT